MKVGLDLTPLHKDSKHKVRGSGFYLKHLLESLEENHPENDYIHISKNENKNPEIDILHIPYFDPFFLTLPLRKKYPTVVTVHDLIPIVHKTHFPVGIKGTLKWNIQRQALRSVDRIITDSTNSKKDIVRILGLPEERVCVIPLAAPSYYKELSLSEKEKSSFLKRYDLPDRFLLYVGDVTWNKNLPRLLRSLSKTDIPCVMVGKAISEKDFDKSSPWNKDRVEVQKLASENKNIHLLGFVPDKDLITIYNMATVCIVPSLSEGFGLPVLEAMNCGLPVITTKEGSLPEVAGDAAYYVDAYDEDSIKAGIVKVFNDLSLQKTLRDESFVQSKKFTWKKTADMTNDVYKEIAQIKYNK